MKIRSNFIKLITKKIPYLYGLDNYLRISIFIFVIIFIIMFLLAPFGFYNFEWKTRIIISFIDGAIGIAAAIMGHQTTVFILKGKKSWNLGKDLLVFFTSIFFGVLFLWIEAQFFPFLRFTGKFSFLILCSITFIIATFCYIPIQYYLRSRYFQKEHSIKEVKRTKRTIRIVDNKEHVYVFEINELIYVKSMGNYVKIYLSKDRRIIEQRIILSMTLKMLKEQIKCYDFIFHCHRSYLININHITKINGGIRNTKIYLVDGSEVPVSRVKIQELKEIINQI